MADIPTREELKTKTLSCLQPGWFQGGEAWKDSLKRLSDAYSPEAIAGMPEFETQQAIVHWIETKVTFSIPLGKSLIYGLSSKPSIIMTGNPVDGYKFYGPFENSDQAVDWADGPDSDMDGDWWMADLEWPNNL